MANRWYMIAATKTGTTLRLWVQQSPTSLTPFNFTPTGTGTSLYRPEGQPTFYVGYSEFGPGWFKFDGNSSGSPTASCFATYSWTSLGSGSSSFANSANRLPYSPA